MKPRAIGAIPASMWIEPLIVIAASAAAHQGTAVSESRPAPASMILDNSYNAFVAVEESPGLKELVHPAIFAKPGKERPAKARSGISSIA